LALPLNAKVLVPTFVGINSSQLKVSWREGVPERNLTEFRLIHSAKRVRARPLGRGVSCKEFPSATSVRCVLTR